MRSAPLRVTHAHGAALIAAPVLKLAPAAAQSPAALAPLSSIRVTGNARRLEAVGAAVVRAVTGPAAGFQGG